MISDSKLLEVAKDSYSVCDAMLKLGLVPMGGNHKLYKRRFTALGVKFKTREHTTGRRREISDYLVLNGPEIAPLKLKKRLLREGIKQEICEVCNQGPNWNNKPLTLQLDHKDGNGRNNQLENLRIICPNCHTQTLTFSGRNRKF